jgi:hypothetical protein
MTKTYPAVLRGGQIEWTDGLPPWANSSEPIQIVVSEETSTLPIHEHVTEEERRRRIAVVKELVGEIRYANAEEEERAKQRVEALRGLAALGGISSIPDPVAWQREQRKDRPLPGR